MCQQASFFLLLILLSLHAAYGLHRKMVCRPSECWDGRACRTFYQRANVAEAMALLSSSNAMWGDGVYSGLV